MKPHSPRFAEASKPRTFGFLRQSIKVAILGHSRLALLATDPPAAQAQLVIASRLRERAALSHLRARACQLLSPQPWSCGWLSHDVSDCAADERQDALSACMYHHMSARPAGMLLYHPNIGLCHIIGCWLVTRDHHLAVGRCSRAALVSAHIGVV